MTLSRQVQNQVGILCNSPAEFEVADIADTQASLASLEKVRYVLKVRGIGHLIQDMDLCVGVNLRHLFGDMRADKARASGNDNLIQFGVSFRFPGIVFEYLSWVPRGRITIRIELYRARTDLVLPESRPTVGRRRTLQATTKRFARLQLHAPSPDLECLLEHDLSREVT